VSLLHLRRLRNSSAILDTLKNFTDVDARRPGVTNVLDFEAPDAIAADQ